MFSKGRANQCNCLNLIAPIKNGQRLGSVVLYTVQTKFLKLSFITLWLSSIYEQMSQQ